MVGMLNRWIHIHAPRIRPRVRLLCFPFAGGGIESYARWHEMLPEWVEVAAVQLPGRGVRFTEQPYSQFESLLVALQPALESFDDIPLALFGHSMGSILAYELARAQLRRGLPEPRYLFVSGADAPQFFQEDALTAGLPD